MGLLALMLLIESQRATRTTPGGDLFHAVRADPLRRLGRNVEAAEAYDAAIASTENASERAFLQRPRRALTHS